VKLQIDKERLRQYEAMVKVGIPGMGYVRFDNNAAWPPMLQVNPNPQIPWKSTESAPSATGPTGAQ
jgi:HlyD family secretion protein